MGLAGAWQGLAVGLPSACHRHAIDMPSVFMLPARASPWAFMTQPCTVMALQYTDMTLAWVLVSLHGNTLRLP